MVYIEKEPLCAWLENMGVSAYIVETIRNEEHFPTADVVEVVRCSECKHLNVLNIPGLYAFCEKARFRFASFGTDTRTHYCCYGERKE